MERGAGHFLRNVGFGQEVAILDRHILKSCKTSSDTPEVPKTFIKNLFRDRGQDEKLLQRSGNYNG